MLTINIYHNNELQKTFANQETDLKALSYLQRSQSHSTDWAIRYEGWKVEYINEETGEKELLKPYDRY